MQANKPFYKRADFILIICIAIVCIISFIPYFTNKSSTPVAVIYKNGEEMQRIQLDSVQDSYTIDLDTNPSNVILVEKNRIRYTTAQCHDKLCVNSGWLSKPGDTAACLPAKTIIVIEGTSDKAEPDIISY